MSRRNKLQKFTENLTFGNVYQSSNYEDGILHGKDHQEVVLKGRWNELHFKNDNPITLELACGKGEYCLGLAVRYPGRNFIGVDIKGARIWRGAKTAVEEKHSNVAFLRTRIEFLDRYFDNEEVSEIWITFPDPFLNDTKSNKRLTSQYFLDIYRKVLEPTGYVHLKTDSEPLYLYTKEVIAEEQLDLVIDNADIYKEELIHPDLDIRTFYEKQHLKNQLKIKFVKFSLGSKA